MSNVIFFILIAFIFSLVMELVMMGAFHLGRSTKAKKILSTLCKLFLGLFIAAYLALIILCAIVGVDFMVKGNVRQGIYMFVTAALVAVCIYVWLIKGWVKYMKEMKKKNKKSHN